MEGMEVCIG